MSIFVPLCNFVNFLIFFCVKNSFTDLTRFQKYENNHGVNTWKVGFVSFVIFQWFCYWYCRCTCAHITIFIADYGNFWAQLSRFSRIFEDFDWAPVIFTQDIRGKTCRIFIWKYFFPKNRKSVTVVPRRIEFQVVLYIPWQNFQKLSSFSLNGRIWLTCRVYLLYIVQYYSQMLALVYSLFKM